VVPITRPSTGMVSPTMPREIPSDDFDDADIWALGREALGLLDALVERRTGV
jgi:hypothetical protein